MQPDALSGSEMLSSTDRSSNAPHFHFLTLFPQTIEVWLTTSILGRAHARGLFSFSTHQLREFSGNRYGSVDDAPYGGGGGMVMKVEPLVAAVEAIRNMHAPLPLTVVYFSPRGRRIDASLLETLSLPPAGRFLFVCGHYEGVDQRFIDHWVDLEVSLGDFVLTGGELPAVALADALIRRIAGTLATEESVARESFSIQDPESGKRLLEYPHYTRPAEFRGHCVPEVLLGGNHREIEAWRAAQSKRITSAQQTHEPG